MPDTSSTRSEDVLTQLVTGPSLREVASNALRTALDSAYPSLGIDPVKAMVVTPTWTLTESQVTPGPRRPTPVRIVDRCVGAAHAVGTDRNLY